MNMKKLTVALFAGFAGVMTVNADPMFYIGEAGYDSWTDAYSAAKNGDTIKVGKGAELKHVSGTISKTLTIDLDGNTLTFVQGWLTGDAKIVDNGGTPGEGLFTMTAYSMNVGGGKLDLSALASDQVSGRFQMNGSSVVKFPSDRPLADCMSAINQKADGAQIVVQGVTYTYDGSDWISDSPVVTYSITITPPQNGTLETSVTNDVAAGTTVTVTAKAVTGYQLVSVTTNGAPITGSSFTMPAADVTLAAAFEAQLTPPDDKAFYVNGKGYDSWSDAMNAAGNGGTVSLGADAEISGTQMYSLTIDLCGHTLTASSTSAPYIGGGVITVSDSVGGGLFTVPNGMNLQGTIDLSALGHDQFAISGNRFWTGSATVAKFPAGWTIDECTATFRNKVVGSKIVVQGVTYTYDGSAWISDSPVVTYSITITPPQNGTLTASAASDIAAGTTIAVTATPATGYQLVSVTTNGAPISGSSFTMPAADVTLAAAFEELPPTPPDEPTQMFYIGETGYDSFADVMVAAKNGDTIKVGKNATFSMSALGGKSITFDLCGRTLTWESGGYVTSGSITVIDSDAPAGRFEFASGNRNYQTLVDMSALTKDQLTGSGKFWSGATTKVVFPADMPFDSALKFMDNKVSGEQIVVQGVTYTYDGSAWISDSPDKPTRGVVIVFE